MRDLFSGVAMKRWIVLFFAVVVGYGCTTTNVERRYAEMPDYVRQQPPAKEHPLNNEGSLWSGGGDLVADIKAAHVGDIVTIIVNEAASSTNKTSVKVSSDSSEGSGLTTFIGAQNTIFKMVNAVAGDGNLASFSGKGSYKGSGEASNSGNLQAKITARVVKVLPNHRLFIRGEKQIYTNGEEQTLIITGVIDSYRITADNTIDSEYISDAKIFYNGKGLISDSRNRGWLAKLWELIRPF